MTVGVYNDLRALANTPPGWRYGRFRVVRNGWKYDVVEHYLADNLFRYVGIRPCWRVGTAMRIAQAMNLARVVAFEEFRRGLS